MTQPTNRHGIPVYPDTVQRAQPKAPAPRPTCAWPECVSEARPGSPFWPLCVLHAFAIVQAVNDLSPHSEYHDKWQEVAAAENARVADARRLKSEVLKSRGDHPGWIYYIRFGDLIKIGYSRDVYRRLRSLAANGVLLAVHPGTLKLEHSLHQQFALHKAARNEYFADVPELRAHIDEVLAQFGPPPAPGTGHLRPALRPRGGVRHFAG